MAEIILLRHGQASLGAANYDQLSELGYQQARRLGEHWRALDKRFDRIVMGTMARHEQTTRSFLQGFTGREEVDLAAHSVSLAAGLNEYNHTYLLEQLRTQFPEHWIDTGHLQRDYYNNIRRSLKYWAEGLIPSDSQDSWQSFGERIQTALHESIEGPFKRVVLVSSGGPISQMLAHFLGLPREQSIDLSLRLKNTSTSTVVTNRVDFTVDTINDASHLQSAEHQHMITMA